MNCYRKRKRSSAKERLAEARGKVVQLLNNKGIDTSDLELIYDELGFYKIILNGEPYGEYNRYSQKMQDYIWVVNEKGERECKGFHAYDYNTLIQGIHNASSLEELEKWREIIAKEEFVNTYTRATIRELYSEISRKIEEGGN